MPEECEMLLQRLTLEEKVALLAGADTWSTVAIERLGIAAIKMTDGPNGARGSSGYTGVCPSACFPAGIALASTWNTELVRRVGVALGQEARTKGAAVVLGPTLNLHRSPVNGRNFECFSEDPLLAARVAAAYIDGLQSQGVAATVKHFACNDSEFERNTISSEVDERALRELYLRPFEWAVRVAGAWCLMTSYNKVRGIHADEHPYLLRDILRREWDFDGVVLSDWGGTTSTAASLNAGLDLEMPGPTRHRGALLLEALARGEMSEATVNASVHRLLKLGTKVWQPNHGAPGPERAVNRADHRAVAREAAVEGMVLLRNERQTLPLSASGLRTLAIIGPNAKVARISGGGSARLKAHYAVTPYDGLVSRLGPRVEVLYEPGCTNHRLLPLIASSLLRDADEANREGLTATFFAGSDCAGEPQAVSHVTSSEQMWFGDIVPGMNLHAFSVRLQGVFTPRTTGSHQFSLTSLGRCRLQIDHQVAIDNWTNPVRGDALMLTGTSQGEAMATMDLVAGQAYPICVVFANDPDQAFLPGFRLGCLEPFPPDAMEQAVAAAAIADVAVIFAGLSDDWDSEGYDRPDLNLVGEQDRLIERVAAANPRTVVVINSGGPIVMPWLDRVAALLQAWYPGQECGNAIADVLLGDVSPSGKLPQTFPQRLEDNPAFINYPGENGIVTYGEGLFIGYRYYDKKNIVPLFPFGFGLSYTSFQYGPLIPSACQLGPDGQLRLSLTVTNSGTRAGKETVQLYIHDLASTLVRPEQELKDFAKVDLLAGQSTTVSFVLGREALAYYDDLKQAWVAEAGEFEARIGASSADIRATARFTLTGTTAFDGATACDCAQAEKVGTA